MAEVTLSPVPVSGGTLIPVQQCHFCRLSGNRYFGVYGQINPNYTFGIVFDVNGLDTATPSTTVVRAQVIPELLHVGTATSQVAYRVTKLNETDVLVSMNGRTTTSSTAITFDVLRYDSATNTISRVATAGQTGLGGGLISTINSSIPPVGVGNNIAIYGRRTATSTFIPTRLTFDPVANTLTSTNLNNGSNITCGSASATGERTGTITITKGRADGLYSFAYTSSSPTSPGSLMDLNQQSFISGFPADTSTVWAPTGSSTLTTGLPVALPLDNATSTLRITSPNSWRAVVNGTTAGADVQFTATPVANTNNRVLDAQWLDSDTFIIAWSTLTSTTPVASVLLSGSRGVRIVKYTDPTFGETSASTTANTVLFTSGFTCDFGVQMSVEKVANNVIAFYGRNGNAFAIRTMYVPG
jgi:hypothetical protein